MNERETKDKLEFSFILESLKRYVHSDPGLKKAGGISFLDDLNTIGRKLDEVVEYREFLITEDEIDFSKLFDLKKLLMLSHIQGNYIAPDKLLQVLAVLRLSRSVKQKLNSALVKNKFPLISSYQSGIGENKILEHNIAITIDDSGNILDNASFELRRIRKNIAELSDVLRKKLRKMLAAVSGSDILQEEIITLRDGRQVIPVKTENKRRVKGIIHGSSSTGQTMFIEPQETIELNNDLTELQIEEKKEIQKILARLTSQISDNSDLLLTNCDVVSEIEIIQAKTKYANEINACKPLLNGNYISLKKAYHPLLLQKISLSEIVPLDIEIGNTFNTLLITGPNAGGKTVCLKTVGLLQYMLQCGLLIPCVPESSTKIFDMILVNIGDEQSIEYNLSTFSSHLRGLKNILDNATGNSLVLIDEICAGTDPAFGSALSSAILEKLSKQNSTTLATTHIGDLKIFAYNSEKIENASLEFDSKTFSPNFKFNIGIPGKSYTFEIAKNYKISDEILDRAKTFINSENYKLEEFLKDVGESLTEYRTLVEENKKKNTELNTTLADYKNRLAELEKEKKSIIGKAKADAKTILQEANSLIEKTIKEIREKDIVLKPKEIKNKFAEEQKKLIGEDSVDKTPAHIALKIGDVVKLNESNSVGKIIEMNEKKYFVNFNGTILKCSSENLVKVENDIDVKNRSEYFLDEYSSKEITSTLDLRGKYPEEVNIIIDEFIFTAQRNSLTELKIIHGKGTGKLRTHIKELLKSNPLVKNMRYGNWNEGDTGVTVITI